MAHAIVVKGKVPQQQHVREEVNPIADGFRRFEAFPKHLDPLYVRDSHPFRMKFRHVQISNLVRGGAGRPQGEAWIIIDECCEPRFGNPEQVFERCLCEERLEGLYQGSIELLRPLRHQQWYRDARESAISRQVSCLKLCRDLCLVECLMEGDAKGD